MGAPAGADVVIPVATRRSGLRLVALRLRSRGRLRVHGRVTVGRGARVAIARGAGVVLEDGSHVGRGAWIEAVGGGVRVGPRTLIGEGAMIVSHAGVRIGADCVVGDFAAVGVPGRPGGLGAVQIGDRVRLGAHAAVESGATIADGSVVGSYAVVNPAPDP